MLTVFSRIFLSSESSTSSSGGNQVDGLPPVSSAYLCSLTCFPMKVFSVANALMWFLFAVTVFFQIGNFLFLRACLRAKRACVRACVRVHVGRARASMLTRLCPHVNLRAFFLNWCKALDSGVGNCAKSSISQVGRHLCKLK